MHPGDQGRRSVQGSSRDQRALYLANKQREQNFREAIRAQMIPLLRQQEDLPMQQEMNQPTHQMQPPMMEAVEPQVEYQMQPPMMMGQIQPQDHYPMQPAMMIMEQMQPPMMMEQMQPQDQYPMQPAMMMMKQMQPPMMVEQMQPPAQYQMPPPAQYQMPPPMHQPMPPPAQYQMPPPMHHQMPPPMHHQMPPPMHHQMPPPMHHQMPPPMHHQMPPPMHHQMPPPMHHQMPPPMHHQMPPPMMMEQMQPPVQYQIQPPVQPQDHHQMQPDDHHQEQPDEHHQEQPDEHHQEQPDEHHQEQPDDHHQMQPQDHPQLQLPTYRRTPAAIHQMMDLVNRDEANNGDPEKFLHGFITHKFFIPILNHRMEHAIPFNMEHYRTTPDGVHYEYHPAQVGQVSNRNSGSVEMNITLPPQQGSDNDDERYYLDDPNGESSTDVILMENGEQVGEPPEQLEDGSEEDQPQEVGDSPTVAPTDEVFGPPKTPNSDHETADLIPADVAQSAPADVHLSEEETDDPVAADQVEIQMNSDPSEEAEVQNVHDETLFAEVTENLETLGIDDSPPPINVDVASPQESLDDSEDKRDRQSETPVKEELQVDQQDLGEIQEQEIVTDPKDSEVEHKEPSTSTSQTVHVTKTSKKALKRQRKAQAKRDLEAQQAEKNKKAEKQADEDAFLEDSRIASINDSINVYITRNPLPAQRSLPSSVQRLLPQQPENTSQNIARARQFWESRINALSNNTSSSAATLRFFYAQLLKREDEVLVQRALKLAGALNEDMATIDLEEQLFYLNVFNRNP